MAHSLKVASLLSLIQLGADNALTLRYTAAGIALYAAVGASIALAFSRSDLAPYWPEINAQWNAIYTILVPVVWLLTGRRDSYTMSQYIGFVMVAVGSYLVK